MKSKSPRQRVKLDRDLIVEAAIKRIEFHGLEELSARKLGQDLGCEAMSLYHHVGNMEELRDLIVDRLLGSIGPAKASGPIEALAEEARSYLDLSETYARTFALIATRRWKGQKATDVAMRSLGYFSLLGLDGAESMARARALGAYLNGAGLALAAWSTDPDSEPGGARQVKSDLLHGLDLLLASLANG